MNSPPRCGQRPAGTSPHPRLPDVHDAPECASWECDGATVVPSRHGSIRSAVRRERGHPWQEPPVPAVRRGQGRRPIASRVHARRSAISFEASDLSAPSPMITLAAFEAAARNVYAAMAPTPQYRVAVARAPRGARGLGQAREPHAHGRVQGARRAQSARWSRRGRRRRCRASSARPAAITGRASRSPRCATACAA